MKITASRYDDLKKAREEYDAETKKLDDTIEEQERQLRSKHREQQADVEKVIADLIGSTSLDLRIKADPWGRYGTDSWAISVEANQSSKFDENRALAWEWSIYTDDKGNIVKDSGSWSGLKVTTPEQIADLEESVRVIKLLNNADWDNILNAPRAEYRDFINKEVSDQLYDRKRNRPKFEADMIDARLEDLIGQDVLVQLSNDEYYNGKVGILLTGMSDKFLKGYIVPWSFISSPKSVEDVKKYAYEPRRTSKTKVMKNDEGMPIEFQLNG